MQVLNRAHETVALPAGCAAGGVVAIDNNSDSTIHVLDHCGTVTIDDCEGCDIVVGPCEESCFVRDCKNCTLHVAAKQLRAKNCTDCTFYLHVGSSPVIEASHDLKFGAPAIPWDGRAVLCRCADRREPLGHRGRLLGREWRGRKLVRPARAPTAVAGDR